MRPEPFGGGYSSENAKGRLRPDWAISDARGHANASVPLGTIMAQWEGNMQGWEKISKKLFRGLQNPLEHGII